MTEPSIKALILDMDGVIWKQNEPIGNLPGIFAEIQDRGLKFCLVTNNSTLTVEAFRKKLAALGVKAGSEQVITSAQAAAHYLKGLFPDGGPVFIIGETGLTDSLVGQGFFEAESDILAVIAGFDREFNYSKLARAALLIRQGAAFIGTNPDRTFPTPEGLLPGAGAILAALQAAAGTDPTIVGKPAPAMYHIALERMQVQPQDVLVIGDRLETDIAGAQQIGCRTGLVLSGVSSHADAQSWQPAVDFIEPDLTTMLSRIK